MDNYLSNLKESKVKSLQELVDWNKAHAKEALTEGKIYPTIGNIKGCTNSKLEYPFQGLLEEGLAFGDSVEAREKPLAHSKYVAANFDEVIEKYNIDVVIAPGDCMLSTYAAAGGKFTYTPPTHICGRKLRIGSIV